MTQTRLKPSHNQAGFAAIAGYGAGHAHIGRFAKAVSSGHRPKRKQDATLESCPSLRAIAVQRAIASTL